MEITNIQLADALVTSSNITTILSRARETKRDSALFDFELKKVESQFQLLANALGYSLVKKEPD